MEPTLTWLGGSCVRLESVDGSVFYVDPWLENENCPVAERDPDRVDAIAITHGHYDHLGETVALCERFSPTVLAITELAMWLKARTVAGTIRPMNIGGSREILGVRVTMTDARHSSSVWQPGAKTGDCAGSPAGFIFAFGPATVYVAGDTGPFGDMALIREMYSPDIAVLPIGDGTTMGPEGAAMSLSLLGSPVCIPCHFDHPSYTGTPEALRELTPARVVTPEPGERVLLRELVGSADRSR